MRDNRTKATHCARELKAALGESYTAGGNNFQWRLFTGVSHTEQNFCGENLDA
jgi:hypothetical protein